MKTMETYFDPTRGWVAEIHTPSGLVVAYGLTKAEARAKATAKAADR